MARIHVVLPDELLVQIDAMVGKRKRSEYIADVFQKELRRQRRMGMATEMMGSLEDVDIPGWETAESIEQWVREQRKWPDPWLDASNANTVLTGERPAD